MSAIFFGNLRFKWEQCTRIARANTVRDKKLLVLSMKAMEFHETVKETTPVWKYTFHADGSSSPVMMLIRTSCMNWLDVMSRVA